MTYVLHHLVDFLKEMFTLLLLLLAMVVLLAGVLALLLRAIVQFLPPGFVALYTNRLRDLLQETMGVEKKMCKKAGLDSTGQNKIILAVDLKECSDCWYYHLSLGAGIKEQQVQVNWREFSGVQASPSSVCVRINLPQKEGNCPTEHHKEHVISLPCPVDPDQLSACFEPGLLFIRVGKPKLHEVNIPLTKFESSKGCKA
jgi:HSP20 family molecular chaperone IbpA